MNSLINKSFLRKYSAISLMHFWKLLFRSGLTIIWFIYCVLDRYLPNSPLLVIARHKLFLGAVWIIFAVEMFLRFTPSRLESAGCQKIFKCTYIPPKQELPLPKVKRRTLVAALAWFALNGFFYALYFTKIIGAGIMILISLLYSVSDMICILFWCPFQTLILKNKCCGTCRIYNWDFAMMATPLIVLKNWYTGSLVILSLALLVQWEYMYRKHPERFFEEGNAALSCANCQERLCAHKESVVKLRKEITAQLAQAITEVSPQADQIIKNVGQQVKNVEQKFEDKIKDKE